MRSAAELIQCPLSKMKPYSLMLSPVYVFLKMNQKFVSIKEPLDFFTPQEIAKLARYESVFVPKSINSAVKFQSAGRLVKSLLNTRIEGLPPTSYEISNEVESVLLPLWGKDLRIEPFFMSIFADELCKKLPEEMMENGRDASIDLHDLGLLLSGASVFFGLQTGTFDYQKVSERREEVYLKTVSGTDWTRAGLASDQLVRDLFVLLQASRSIDLEVLKSHPSEWCRRISSRLKRFQEAKRLSKEKSPSMYGEEGFAI